MAPQLDKPKKNKLGQQLWSFRYTDEFGNRRRETYVAYNYKEAEEIQRAFLSSLYAKRRAGNNCVDFKELLWKDLCNDYLQHSRQTKDAPEADEQTLNSFNKLMSITYAKECTTEKLMEYREKRLAQGIKKSTINRQMNTFKALFTWACKKWNIQHPARDIKKYSVPIVVKDRWLTQDEVKLVFNCIRTNVDHRGKPLRMSEQKQDRLITLMFLQLSAGLRLKEARCARWIQVKFEESAFEVKPFKTSNTDANSVMIPMHSILKGYLLELRKKYPKDEFIVPFIDEKRRFAKDSLICHEISGFFGSIGLKDVTSHTCRHTFVSALSMKGLDKIDIMEFARIKNFKTLKAYEHLRPDFNTKKIDKLDYFA